MVQATRKAERIAQVVADLGRGIVFVTKTPHCISLERWFVPCATGGHANTKYPPSHCVLVWFGLVSFVPARRAPYRTIQINLSLFRTKAEVLASFDLDCVAVCFDGTRVECLPRFRRAVITRTVTVNANLRAHSYIRLFKYCSRGWSFVLPDVMTVATTAKPADVDGPISYASTMLCAVGESDGGGLVVQPTSVAVHVQPLCVYRVAALLAVGKMALLYRCGSVFWGDSNLHKWSRVRTGVPCKSWRAVHTHTVTLRVMSRRRSTNAVAGCRTHKIATVVDLLRLNRPGRRFHG